jgi:hypothetical protein
MPRHPNFICSWVRDPAIWFAYVTTLLLGALNCHGRTRNIGPAGRRSGHGGDPRADNEKKETPPMPRVIERRGSWPSPTRY